MASPRQGPQGSEASTARGPYWGGAPDASRSKNLEASRPILRPAPDAPVAVADERYLLPADFEGKPRTGPVSGAFAR